MMTKEEIEKKMKELEVQRQNAIAQVNSINGAIQILQYILKEEKTNDSTPASQ